MSKCQGNETFYDVSVQAGFKVSLFLRPLAVTYLYTNLTSNSVNHIHFNIPYLPCHAVKRNSVSRVNEQEYISLFSCIKENKLILHTINIYS